MPCGCTDRLNSSNKILHNNTQLDNKILNIYSMSSMPIDEIVNLYRQGYLLEGSKSLYSSMTYPSECSGTPTVDKSNSTSGLNLTLGMPHAIAQKFTPTSVCLQSVTIRAKQVYPGIMGLTVYIAKDEFGLPHPNWQSGGGYGSVTKSNSEISSVYTDLNFIFNIRLDNSNPLWIVVIPDSYSPDYDDGNYYIDLEEGDVPTSATALKVETGNWSLRSGDSLVYSTFKQSYSLSQVLTSIVLTPATSSVQIGSTQSLEATCKDQNTVTMTCSTPLIWSSTSPSKATVNSSGTVTGVASGTTNITARYGTVTSNQSTITVSSSAQVLTSVSPASITILPDTTRQFTARDQFNNAISTDVTWEVQSGGGSIGITGLYSAGPTVGTAIIKATYLTVSKTASVTISTTLPVAGGGDSSMLIGIVGVVALGMMMTAKKP